MTAMLAKPYSDQNPAGWLMSEKLDGVRALWDGEKLISRNGNVFSAPPWFISQLPAGVLLDGELYIGRGDFQCVAGYVRRKKPIDIEWAQIRYHVFDAPAHPAGFEERLAFCAGRLSECAVATVVPHIVCTGKAHLHSFFTDIVQQDGEGVMLRKPGSQYEPGRSNSLLKYKRASSDEAIVIGHVPGIGKHEKKLGALICRMHEKTFCIGTGFSDIDRIIPPPVGACVTFEYIGLTGSGLPRSPVFIAVRDYE